MNSILLYQNVGKPELWAEAGGPIGLVLMALIILLMIVVGAFIWFLKNLVKTNEKNGNEFVKAVGALKGEMSQNTLDITRPLVEFNQRQIATDDKLDQIKKKQEEGIEDMASLLSKVELQLKNVSNHLEINNQTLKNIHKI